VIFCIRRGFLSEPSEIGGQRCSDNECPYEADPFSRYCSTAFFAVGANPRAARPLDDFDLSHTFTFCMMLSFHWQPQCRPYIGNADRFGSRDGETLPSILQSSG
jgi:hypothetical protein